MVFTQGLALFKLAQILHKELSLNVDHFLHFLHKYSVLTLHLALRRLAGDVVLIQKVWKGQTALEHKGPQSKMKKMGYIT